MSTWLTFPDNDASPAPLSHIAAHKTASATPPSAAEEPSRPAIAPPPHGLNPRSCVTCRKRKVRCDKKLPCSNCSKASIQCIFPAPGRAPRRPRAGGKPVTEREAELLKRLRRLEGVVQELSGQGENGDKQSPSSAGSSGAHKEGDLDINDKSGGIRVIGMDEGRSKKDWMARTFNLGNGPPKPLFHLEQSFGRLVVDEGKSEYINDPFWASITDEDTELPAAFDEASESDEDGRPILPSDIMTEPDHQSFIMGYNSADVDLRSLHPLPSQIPFYWQTYLENVDPLVKITHIGTMTKVIKAVQNNLDSLSKSTEALMFAIYFATITSMNAEEVLVNFGVDKATLSKRYRFAVEQALARASFLNTQEIVTVQAFVLFLVCVRRHDDTRFVWSLTGLALRIAQAIGLHRDGTNFGLSPFDTEMRRRLWWQVCTLDLRASEDHGTDPSIYDQSYDTQLPLSINDDDLHVDATEYPKPRPGVSEMTFCLIRYEICTLTRRLLHPGIDFHQDASQLSHEDRERIIKECASHLEKTYLQYCEDAGPLFWVAATVARLIMAKMTLIVYHPLISPGKPNNLTQDCKDRLLMSSLEILEYSRVLEAEATSKHWGWLFHTYIQWHAIAYILGELCTRPRSQIVDRAWRAIDGVFTDWGVVVSHSKRSSLLWKPMMALMAKARRKREEDMNFDSTAQEPGISERFLKPEPVGLSTSMSLLESNVPGNCRQQESNQAGLSQGISQSLQTPSNMYTTTESMVEPQVVGMGMLAPENIQLQLQQERFAQQGTPWIMDDNALQDLDMTTVDADVNWEGWDDLVRNFQLEADQQMGGPALGGMGQWW
ncbi:fungal specific transcription factor domain-containing protein [Phlyctema vagabunda]|uniref:Fungal specific transcription factor domain-containing protein n=1 Tax=Phlyctema vagabunda TaxID=108571 RepID=A0ABR4PQV0_9HELO